MNPQHQLNPPVSGTEGYGEQAKQLALQYETLEFEQVHRDVLYLLPAAPADVLDIGAGSGRDAAALARRGYRVTAAEPTAALREEGQRLHAGVPVRWVDSPLPDLPGLAGGAQRFDLILLSAVWMHLDAVQRTAGMAALSGLLKRGGIAILTLRHGPVPAGRRMFDVSADESITLGTKHGLVCEHRGRRADVQGRPGVNWSVVALRQVA